MINERTTVAAAYAMAQFIDGRFVGRPSPGLRNAALMAKIWLTWPPERWTTLASSPNGTETSAMREFNSLSNLLGHVRQ